MVALFRSFASNANARLVYELRGKSTPRLFHMQYYLIIYVGTKTTKNEIFSSNYHVCVCQVSLILEEIHTW